MEIVQAALQEVGRRWERNEVSVAQEHLATAITQRVLAQASLRASYLPANGRRALLACVQGNRHSVGLRIVADTLEIGGWEACFLGADVPNADLLAFASMRRPHLIALSLSLPEQLAPTRDAIRDLRDTLGDDCPPIWVGGLVTLRSDQLWRKLGADGWAVDALGRLALG